MAYTANLSSILTSVNTPVSVSNFLKPNGFRFTIKELPKVAYTVQSVNLPGVTLGVANMPTPFIDIPIVGDKMTFGDLNIRFIVSEDLSNYEEIYDWIVAIGFPDSYNQYGRFSGDRLARFPFVKTPSGGINIASYSDATLTILDSNNNPKTNIHYYDIFPTSLEALDFDATVSTIDYFVAIASFKYKAFEIEAL